MICARYVYELGFAAGVQAAQRVPALIDDRRWRVEFDGFVLRGVTIYHFCEQNGYTGSDRGIVENMRDGETITICGRHVTRGDHYVY